MLAVLHIKSIISKRVNFSTNHIATFNRETELYNLLLRAGYYF